MRNKIFTAFILTALMLILSANESAASYKTKLRLVIEKPAPEIPGKVSKDLIDDDGIYSGTVTSRDTYTDAQGRSVTETVTVFTDRTGKLMLSADVAITTNSTDFAVNAGEKFAQTVKVDAELEIADTDYSMYIFSMDIADLPEWLKAEGELTYSADFDPEERFIEYHHEFEITGTPSAAMSAKNVVLNAKVYVSGDMPILRAEDSKDVNISVQSRAEPPPEPEPPIESPDISPDVPVPESPDISPDVPVPRPPDISPDVPVPRPPDVSPDVPVPRPPDDEPDDRGYDNYLDTKDRETDDDKAQEAVSLTDIIETMSQKEIEAITILKVDGNVSDLSGLKAFTNLEVLDLTEAYLLEDIDISGNTTIKSLDVSGNPSVKSLNVEDCVNLEILDCSDCRLEKLNIRGCASLNVLNCSNNRLSKLDAYMFIRLRELICSNQNITGWKLARTFSFVDYFMQKVIASDAENGYEDSGVENVINLRAWDADGEEISAEYAPETGNAIFGNKPAKITYDYITGFDGVKMDVTVFAAGYEGSDLGSPKCGGCNMGITFPIYAMALVMLLLRRRR